MGCPAVGTFLPERTGACLMTRDAGRVDSSGVGILIGILEVQMSSTLVRVGGVAAVIASLLIVGQQAWGLAGGGVIEEGMGESALHTAQI